MNFNAVQPDFRCRRSLTDRTVPVRLLRIFSNAMGTEPRMDEAREVTTLTVAIAMVLPILGIVLYGFRIGWTSLGIGSLAVMVVVATVYYLLLRLMMKYRQR